MSKTQGNVIKVFGEWFVTDCGVECPSAEYVISFSRLNERNWIDHVSKKTWVDMDDFGSAFEFAKSYQA
ncbi:hypothetical protein ACRWQL_00425 (plasmid) [Shewanella sp. HL-SH4]|uniref:hypothetical protein n=1 Tax=Shewanella sp. HL-SH4 TaxID=3436240 RepID=UPI003EBC493C